MQFILTLSCPNRAGIVHAVSTFLLEEQGDIVQAAQFDDTITDLFFMRVKFTVPDSNDGQLNQRFESVARQFDMSARFTRADARVPTVIMVSQLGHCLNDLLFRYSSNLLPIDIRAIVSNHKVFYQLAASHGIPFHYVPVTADSKPAAEAKMMEIFNGEGAELLVLARYMQILSDDLCKQLSGRAINIHHSFLPSFKGARPYKQACDRGVKLIGATAHYVTGDLDEGPIIEQDVERVDHAATVEDLTAIGRDIERVVLARAVRWHAERRVLINGNKTVVFR